MASRNTITINCDYHMNTETHCVDKTQSCWMVTKVVHIVTNIFTELIQNYDSRLTFNWFNNFNLATSKIKWGVWPNPHTIWLALNETPWTLQTTKGLITFNLIFYDQCRISDVCWQLRHWWRRIRCIFQFQIIFIEWHQVWERLTWPQLCSTDWSLHKQSSDAVLPAHLSITQHSIQDWRLTVAFWIVTLCSLVSTDCQS